MVEWCISGATIVDGTGAAPFRGNVLIDGGRMMVTPVGSAHDADRTIEANGLVVAPGFIDIHSHNDLVAITGGDLNDKILQGVTTEVNGNCGFSPYPITPLNGALVEQQLSIIAPGQWTASWDDWGGFAAASEQAGLPVNVVGQVGHGTLRSAVMGMGMEAPDVAQMREMERLLSRSLEEGASGLSFGLMYHPSGYATIAEITALCRVAAAHDAFVSVHLRAYDRSGLYPSMREMLDAVMQAGARLQFSHLAPTGADSKSLVDDMLLIVEDAVAAGVDVAFDRYPYEDAYTKIALLIPGWALSGSSPELFNSELTSERSNKLIDDINERVAPYGYDAVRAQGDCYGHLSGKSVTEIAAGEGSTPALMIVKLARRFGADTPITIRLNDTETQEAVLQHPLCMVGSDGVPCSTGTHPRTFGTFARVVGPVVRRGVISLEQAVHKMTGQPATWLGLTERGFIRSGFHADLVLFDPITLSDEATFENPYVPPKGIEAVFVNGVCVVLDGAPTKEKPGRVITARR